MYVLAYILIILSGNQNLHTFFFSSRRQHTRFSRDWSSDVCSSDLQAYRGPERRSEDPLNLLGRRLNAVCVEAVDPLQIAAALEADGLDDELVASTYSMA